MKKLYSLALVALTLSLGACSKKEEAAPAPTTTALSATINGAQQVPANSSAATGTFVGSYDSGNKLLTYKVTYQGVTPSIAHIHIGAPGMAGPVAIPFANLASPITGTVTLTADQADNLLSNKMYVNMHSSAYANGEIRGDIHK